jgi:hypothetical protein
MKRLLLVFLSVLTNLLLNAQVYSPAQNIEKSNRPQVVGNLNINQDPRLDKMLSWHIEKITEQEIKLRVLGLKFFLVPILMQGKNQSGRKRNFYRFIPTMQYM